jgi:hypothetical protein
LRLLAAPPLVNEPVAHALHVSAPSADHFFSSPQGRHPAVPAAEYVPPEQVPTDDVPSQSRPTLHGVHVVRVVLVPPDVDDVAAQTEQEAAAGAEYFPSSPHAVHVSAPAALKVPAGQAVFVLPPSHP